MVIFTINGCISNSVFASLIGIPVGITTSAIGFKICPINAEIKNYKSINKENENKNDKMISLAKS